MKKLTLTFAVLFFIAGTFTLSAQNKKEAKHNIKVGINAHALVGVHSSGNIVLQPEAPTEAGEGLNFDVQSAKDNSVWLNYSSIVDQSKNSISVSMDGDKLPDGVTIEVVAAADAGQGNGEVGTSANSAIVLKKQEQDIVTGIGNCYTGKGQSKGHNLAYTLKMDESGNNYKDLTSGSFDMTITYTITEN